MRKKGCLKSSIIKNTAVILAAVFTCLLGLCACSDGEKISLSVFDCGVSTKLEVKAGIKVSDVLREAEIMIGEKDEVEPSADSEAVSGATITVKRYAEVEVVYNGEKKSVSMVGGKVEDAVKKSGFELGGAVNSSIDKFAYLKNGMIIKLFKGTAVSLTMDGKTLDIVTEAATVAQFLAGCAVKEIAGFIDHHPHHQFSYRIRILSRSVFHNDPSGSRSFEIDIIITGAGPDDQLKFRCMSHHIGSDLIGTDD